MGIAADCTVIEVIRCRMAGAINSRPLPTRCSIPRILAGANCRWRSRVKIVHVFPDHRDGCAERTLGGVRVVDDRRDASFELIVGRNAEHRCSTGRKWPISSSS